ncbi:MAG: hypothetical protein HKP25_02585 [Marinicaulis sp.]|nr:hypothetical protein [Marinicaulis sp.]
MTAGRDVLHRIDGSIAEARRALSDISRAASLRSERISAIERAETDALRSIASIRVENLQSDDLVHSLGAADEKAEKLLADHDAHLKHLSEDLDEARRNIEKLEADRRGREEKLQNAVDAHEKAVDKTNNRLANDPEYVKRANALEEANAIAERAEAKLDLVRADREEKGAPYENDPLFSYLWNRKFGTKDYKAFFLFAALDRWVASLIKYRDAKLNYARLLELPERFSDHLQQVTSSAEAIEADIEQYERDALTRDGVGKLRDKVEKHRRALEEIDNEIDKAEKRHLEISDEHARVAAGDAGPVAEARRIVARALSDRSIPDLKVLAAQTVTLDDDRLVEELVRLKRERFEIEENGDALRRNMARQSSILKDLETIRRRFKTARYDSPYSEFPDHNIVGIILSEILRGALSHNDGWRRLQRAQRRRRHDWTDDFGGDEWRDGFGLPQDPWRGRGPKVRFPGPRMPRRRSRAPRIRIPRGRAGGGGFKTGGGF